MNSALRPPQSAISSKADSSVYRRRRLVNRINMGASMFTMAFGLFWLFWILSTLLQHGLTGLNWEVFTASTPPPGSTGGLANAIYGDLMMTAFGTLFGTPIGILAGIYLAEFGQRGWLAPATRFINDILLSAPSIVIGLFIYEVYVVSVGHFSGWAGSFALAILVIPVVVRTTENMLRLVPGVPARSRVGAGRAAVEGDLARHPAFRQGRRADRHPAGGGAHFRRNRAAAVHRAEQPVLQ